MRPVQLSTLKKINTGLILAVGCAAIFIGLAPIAPYALLIVQGKQRPQTNYTYQSVLARTDLGAEAAAQLKQVPKENTLVIPGIGVDGLIFEGNSDAVLAKGIWHRPRTGDPTHGNLVLSAHRYLYTSGPKSFFFLDRVHIGDKIIVFWQGVEYDYEVTKTFVVPPTQTSIEAPTKDRLLTLYTCTPLWTSTKRLVVQAKPIESK